MTRYEVVPFRPTRSRCPECDSNILHLRPQFLEIGDDLPSFFLCTTCNYVGQPGVAKLWPKEDAQDMFGPSGAIENGVKEDLRKWQDNDVWQALERVRQAAEEE